jgi:hypothetical protein
VAATAHSGVNAACLEHGNDQQARQLLPLTSLRGDVGFEVRHRAGGGAGDGDDLLAHNHLERYHVGLLLLCLLPFRLL